MNMRTRILRTYKAGSPTILSRIRKIAIVTSLASAALFAVDASAYTRLTCNGKALKRASNAVTMNASTSFGSSGGWLTPLGEAIQAANVNPSAFGYSFSTGDGDVAKGNGQNEIWWDSKANIGASARTFAQNNCGTGTITESDIVFANDVSWTASNAINKSVAFGAPQSRRPFATAAVHELGHVGGLDHTADTYSIMGQDYTHVHVNGNLATPYFGGDAGRGMVDIYGPWAVPVSDMSVTNMRYSHSNSDGYSVHVPTSITKSSGGSLNATFGDPNGVLGYLVNKGQAVTAEFNFENLGNQFLTNIWFNYYISTDNVINSSDTQVAGGILYNQPLGTVYPVKWPITIPSNLVSGQVYYLGVIIDSNNAIAEFSESNNYTYIPIMIN